MGKVKVKKGSGALLDAGCPICGSDDLSQKNRTPASIWVLFLILAALGFVFWPLWVVAFFLPLFGNVKFWKCGGCGWKSE